MRSGDIIGLIAINLLFNYLTRERLVIEDERKLIEEKIAEVLNRLEKKILKSENTRKY